MVYAVLYDDDKDWEICIVADNERDIVKYLLITKEIQFRLQWRIQPIEQIRKRKQRRREMWKRHQQFVEFVKKGKRKNERHM